MRKVLGLVSLLLTVLTVAAVAEPPDSLYKLLTRQREPCCADFVYNAQLLIPMYYAENRPDSIRLIIDYVKGRCGAEPFKSFELLSAVERHELADSWCDSAVAEDLFGRHFYSYHVWYGIPDYFGTGSGQSSYSQDCANVEADYSEFIRSIAEGLLPETRPGSAANLLCEYYAKNRDTIMVRLKNKGYPGTCFQDKYRSLIDSLVTVSRAARANMALIGGAWLPSGAAHSLGDKMELGFLFGGRWHAFGFDIPLILRMIGAAHPYSYPKGNRMISTRQFIGGYIGFEPTWQLIRLGRLETELSAGMAYDGFGPTSTDEDHKWECNSLNLNTGITQRFYLDKYCNRYIGLRIRYNCVKYGTGGGTDLSGDAATIHLIFGYMGRPGITSRLKNLKYYR